MKSKIKVLLAGTPNFSVATFTNVIENFEVVALITQPNRASGRNLIITPPPTAMVAKLYNIPILQPEKISDIYDQLKQLDFDILLTMAYGQIIDQKTLDLAKIGSFNIHASLLPKYRGASPIQYALLNGEKQTGITLMQMNSKLDAGDIIFQDSIDIEQEDTQDKLLNKLSKLSAHNIVDWLNKIANNNFNKQKQDESKVTLAPKISKEDERLEFDTIDNTLNKIKALSSNPGAYLILNTDQTDYTGISNKRIKIFFASKQKYPNSIEIKCKDGLIYATDFQFEGRRRINILEG